jgi:hypothetical protein
MALLVRLLQILKAATPHLAGSEAACARTGAAAHMLDVACGSLSDLCSEACELFTPDLADKFQTYRCVDHRGTDVCCSQAHRSVSLCTQARCGHLRIPAASTAEAPDIVDGQVKPYAPSMLSICPSSFGGALSDILHVAFGHTRRLTELQAQAQPPHMGPSGAAADSAGPSGDCEQCDEFSKSFERLQNVVAEFNDTSEAYASLYDQVRNC